MAAETRWQANRIATRRHIALTALTLFGRHGFEVVTVAEIAAAAGVSERTVYRYYPTKTDIVMGDEPGALAAFVAGLDAAPPGLTPGAALLAMMRAAAPSAELREVDRMRTQLIQSTPALHRAWLALLDELTPAFRQWLATRTGRPADSPEVHVAAAALLAAHRWAVEEWNGQGLDAYYDTLERQTAVLDAGLASLDARA